MRRALIALLLTSLLGGCAESMITLGNGQLNRAAEPFPSDYLTSAAQGLVGQAAAPGQTLAVSYPQLTIGTTAIDPQRWYVCVRGLQPKAGAPDTQPILVYGRFGTPLLVRTSVANPCLNATGYQNLKPA